MKVIELTRGHVAIIDDEDFEKLAHLIEALFGLTHELRADRAQRVEEEHRRSLCLATKKDLRDITDKIMATQAEIVADLKGAVVNLKQVNVDIADTQKQINELKTAIVDLQKLVDAGGGITPELVEAVAEVKALAAAADEALPNAVVVPPSPV